jgi:hypothetical protein
MAGSLGRASPTNWTAAGRGTAAAGTLSTTRSSNLAAQIIRLCAAGHPNGQRSAPARTADLARPPRPAMVTLRDSRSRASAIRAPNRYGLPFSRLGVARRTFHLVLYAGRALSCRLPWPGLLLLLRAAVRFRRGVSQPPAVEVRYQREGGRYRGGGNGRPVGFQNSVTSPDLGFLGGSLVFVDEAAEDGTALDLLLGEIRDRVVGAGRAEMPAAVGAASVVVGLVLGQD